MRDKFVRLIEVFGIIVGTLLIGYILLVVVYLIPTEAIYENVKESADIIQKEGLYPSIYAAGTYLDNWTDADCISVAYNVGTNNPFYNALNAFQRYSNEEVNKWGTHNLIATIEERTDAIADHSYLWNGFRIFLRPLLFRYNIAEIRQILSTFTLILVVVLSVNIVKVKKSIFNCLPFLIAIGLMNFQLESVSLLFCLDINIALIACVFVLKSYESKDYGKIHLIFALTGVAVGFSSMLIIPSITLGLPLIVTLSLWERGNNKVLFAEFVKNVVAWVCGYGITMISKIVISSLIIRESRKDSQVTRYLAINDDNLLMYRVEKLIDKVKELVQLSQIQIDVWGICIVMFLLLVIVNWRYILKNILHFMLLFVVFCIPFVWILLVVNHTHHGFTLFNFAISIFALCEVLVELLMVMFRKGVGHRE